MPEIGDEIECFDNLKVEGSLTAGKKYTIVGAVPVEATTTGTRSPNYVLSDTVFVRNNNGFVCGYFKSRFKEFRG